MSLHPIADKGKVSVDLPANVYTHNFSHSQFDAYADGDNAAIGLVQLGQDRREAVVHLNYGLLANIFCELARSLAAREPARRAASRRALRGATHLAAALEPRVAG